MTRRLVTSAEHTIDLALLTPGGWVLDVGCRNFTFARELAEHGCQVVAIDADPTVEDPKLEHVTFKHLALAPEPGDYEFLMHDNPEARCLVFKGNANSDRPRVTVQADTIEQLTARAGISQWDVVKLDVEGAEYDILRKWPGPIAKQISVEFHEHCYGRQPDSTYDGIIGRLASFGYEVVRHERDSRMCAGMNFWDSLFALEGRRP